MNKGVEVAQRGLAEGSVWGQVHEGRGCEQNYGGGVRDSDPELRSSDRQLQAKVCPEERRADRPGQLGGVQRAQNRTGP